MSNLQKKSNGFAIVEFLIILVVLIAISLASYFVGRHAINKTAPTTASSSSTAPSSPTAAVGSANQVSTNTSRQNDATAVIAGVDQSIDNNLMSPSSVSVGSSSKTLNICGSNCSSSSTVSVNLKYFTASAVSMHTYSNTLTMKNTQEVYIVQNASCNTTLTSIAPPNSGKKFNMAVLYALQDGSSIVQKCLPS